ncbi:MAG: hypothetical protein GY803_23130, partial [Chloroflexi bacterium]|nr:hypothetical protein [Chloroflexota bacterium]
LDGRGQYSDAQPQVLGAAAAVPILPPPASGVDVSGLITSDTTWTAAQSPYIVTDVVTVTDGVTLTIEPGVQVMLEQYQSLIVEGNISAVGTAAEPITFTAHSEGSFFSWEEYDDTTFEDAAVQSVVADENGDIWFAGFYNDGSSVSYGTVYRWYTDLQTWDTPYEMPNDTNRYLVYDLAIDSLGQKWIATGSGVEMLDADGNWAPSYYHDPNQPSLASDTVFAVAVDANDNVWFGTDGAGVSKKTSSGWATYTTMHGLASDTVYAIAVGDDGSVWFGTDNGLSKLSSDGVTFTNYDTGNSNILSNTVEDIAIDSENNIWTIHPFSGVGVLSNSEEWTTYIPDNSGLVSAFVQSITVDRSGRKWIGYTMDGVSILSADNLEWNYETTPRLSGNDVVDMAAAPNGDVWLVHDEKNATRGYGGAGVAADGTIRSGYWNSIQIGGGDNLNDSDNSQLSYITIEAGGASGQPSLLINQSSPMLNNLRVWGSGDHGIAVSGSVNFSLSDSVIVANRKDGVHIESNSGGHTLNNITVQGNNGHGIYLDHPGAVSITEATIVDNQGHGIFTDNSDNALSLTGSTVQGNGVAARLAVNATLTNNQWLENEAQQIEWLGGTLNANRTWANEVDAYVVLATIN